MQSWASTVQIVNLFEIGSILVLSAAELAVIAGAVYLINRRLQAVYADRPEQQFRRQMIMVGVVLGGVLLGVMLLPVSSATRNALLSLFGIVLSATIALSSANLVGNIMAGIMLRTVGGFRLGDYISVGEHFGRVSEMDLLHTEIQTEERDLTTLPNTYLAARPVKVMRQSGSILSVELSLGYDVSRHVIEKQLLEAAARCELESPFVQIRNLGDYSITYAVAGLLTDVKSLLGKRRALRAATIDVLHEADIEIASPVLASTRTYPQAHQFLSRREAPAESETANGAEPDTIVFDKAMQAEGLDKLRERRRALSESADTLRASVAPDEVGGQSAELQRLESRLARLDEVILERETLINKD